MSITVHTATEEDIERWNRCVSQSAQASPFHRYEVLELLSRYSETTCYPLIGLKGEEPIGLLPIFERNIGPIQIVTSPPGGFEVYYLGVALSTPSQLKQRKTERRNRQFIDGCVEWIEQKLNPDVIHIRSGDRYTDVRPLKRNHFDTSPYYTYVVDLSPGEEDVMMSFSSDARSNIRSEDDDYEIRIGEEGACERIINHVIDRLDSISVQYNISPAYARDLSAALPKGIIQPYECFVGGESVGGIITLEGSNTVYRWQGGTKQSGNIPVNDVLDWRIMQDAIDCGIERYDLYGANIERTATYKSKFGPDPISYYSAMRRSPRATLLSWLRNQFPTEDILSAVRSYGNLVVR
jgi:hypothetical protein